MHFLFPSFESVLLFTFFSKKQRTQIETHLLDLLKNKREPKVSNRVPIPWICSKRMSLNKSSLWSPPCDEMTTDRELKGQVSRSRGWASALKSVRIIWHLVITQSLYPPKWSKMSIPGDAKCPANVQALFWAKPTRNWKNLVAISYIMKLNVKVRICI